MPEPILQDYFRTLGETTALSPDEEAAFRAWAQQNNVTDVDQPDSFYDYRGAYKAGLQPDDSRHWPDTFKQHGHPTFSIESQYSQGPGDGGRWDEQGRFIPAMSQGYPYDFMSPEDAAYLMQRLQAQRDAQSQADLGHLRSILTSQYYTPTDDRWDEDLPLDESGRTLSQQPGWRQPKGRPAPVSRAEQSHMDSYLAQLGGPAAFEDMTKRGYR